MKKSSDCATSLHLDCAGLSCKCDCHETFGGYMCDNIECNCGQIHPKIERRFLYGNELIEYMQDADNQR